ncbi:hypothetical protein Gotur_035727 [Gossypium turneri]
MYSQKRTTPKIRLSFYCSS